MTTETISKVKIDIFLSPSNSLTMKSNVGYHFLDAIHQLIFTAKTVRVEFNI